MQHCPICNKKVKKSPRYPTYVCGDCISGKGNFTIDGKLVDPSEVSYFIKAVNCEVKGVPCILKEAHFGGEVITTRKI